MDLKPGAKLGPYEILSLIGEGGMGQVWKARDTRLDRIVAIKVSAQVFSDRFEREARAVAALNHPNICTLYDVGPDYLVMEFVDGAELAGPLPLDQALRIAIQLASALDAAHRKTITHRDLKPSNILTTKSGIKVLDFGLAKIGQDAQPPGPDDVTMARPMTREGTIVGTPQFMAPEQLQGKPADARSDIFSFGCVLYEMLTGKRAFRAENQATLIADIIAREPEPIALHQPTIPPMLERVVKKCLAKDPDDRWQSAADLKSQLEWVLESGSNAGMPAPVLQHPRKNARLGWILAGVFAALLAAFAVFHFRPASAPATMVRFEIPPPEGTSWNEIDTPIVSPDGSRIMFGATRRDGTRSLWMRPMDSVNAQLIPGTENSPGGAAWAPDARSIVFIAEGKLMRLELAGGSPRVLTPTSAYGRPAWSPAGIILFTRFQTPYQLYQVPASGGEAKPANPGLNTFQIVPGFLPGGRQFLYASGGANAGLYAGSLDSKEVKRVNAGSSGIFVPPEWLLNVRGSTLFAQSFDPGKGFLSGEPIPIADKVAAGNINGAPTAAFSVSQNGVLVYRQEIPTPSGELTWFDRQGKRLSAAGEPATYSNPALSPDGKRLAVGRLDPATNTRDIWVLDLTRGVGSRFTFDKSDDLNPVWSPDGSRIAFSSDRKGRRDIYWKAAGGAGAEEPVLEGEGSKSMEDWSADGKLLVFNVNNGEIHAVPVTGDRKPFPVLKAPFVQTETHLSPDGHWIAYGSLESGRREVFVQNFPPAGGKWQISTSGGSEPAWRRDGKELFFMSGTKLEVVEVKANGSSFEAGIPKELFDVPELTNAGHRNRYVATADGQRFLFVTTPRNLDTSPFVVVQNWQTALKH
jgi:Tol biopolymer transport system component/tRNA A-37 threonylcarbamoyl transferase component Bud32